MAKSTIVSTLPFTLVEPKPGLIPSIYEIRGARKPDIIGTTQVDDGYHLFVVPLSAENSPPMRVTDTSEKIAKSIIDDIINSMLSVSYEQIERDNETYQALPGLFWIPGVSSIADVMKTHKSRVNQALGNTILWFENLVKLADDDWNKNHQFKTISDLQRKACGFLNLSRDWNFDAVQAMNNRCWACQQSFNPGAILCGNCKAILDKEAFEKRKSEFAQV